MEAPKTKFCAYARLAFGLCLLVGVQIDIVYLLVKFLLAILTREEYFIFGLISTVICFGCTLAWPMICQEILIVLIQHIKSFGKKLQAV